MGHESTTVLFPPPLPTNKPAVSASFTLHNKRKILAQGSKKVAATE